MAWRPVLLVPGWNPDQGAMKPGTAWADGLAARDVAHQPVDLAAMGAVRDNAAQITGYAADLCRRFGVQRINVVAHSKGGVDTREHVESNDNVDTLIMLATPNAGSFVGDLAVIGASATAGLVGLGVAWADVGEMTTLAMAFYNGGYVRNRQTAYVATAGDYDSVLASSVYGPVVGGNDEVVSVASVLALSYASGSTYATSTTDAESQGICATNHLFNHSCLRYYSRIVDDLFARHLAVLTPPPPAPRAVAGGPALAAEAESELRVLMSGAALTPAEGVTDTYAVLVDAAEAALFTVLTDQETVRLELVSPSGTRLDPATADPAIVYVPASDGGMFWYTAYRISAAETGTWTLEVTSLGTASPGSGYTLAALTQLPAGTGVELAVQMDDLRALGVPATITATLTSDGAPVTGATVRATVKHPDRATITDLEFAEAGDGQYTAGFAAAAPGLHTAVVHAEATTPAFTREQLLVATAAPSTARFTGTISDRGLDTDGDGRFDQLLVDIGVEVDVAAGYRLHAVFTDSAGTTIEQVRAEQQLQPGAQTVELAFAGSSFYASGSDGPYLLDDLVLEDVVTGTGLARGPAYQSAAYAHTDFQRPPLVLTGTVSDHGAHFVHMERMPYEELVIDVELDLAVAAELTATANLYAEDGTFVTATSTFTSLEAGVGTVEFHIPAHSIFQAGRAGPYTLSTLSLWGTAADGSPLDLRAPGTVTVTQPYLLEDFAESPRFTVGGTVTGLTGFGQLELELSCQGPPGTPATVRIRPGNGPFTFTFPTLVSGNTYQVAVTRQPVSPAQVCTVANAAGTVEDANVTDITVSCQ